MKPEIWLKALAGAYPRYEMSDLQAKEYLLELDKWILTDDEWVTVRSIAKRRHTFFPSYAELDEIMREIRRDGAFSSRNGDPVWELFEHEGKCCARRRTG